MKVAPSILSADFGNLIRDIKKIEDVSEYLHLDVMDNIFVPNKTFDFHLVSSIRPQTTMVFDTHLMIINPLEMVRDYALAGSDIITFHFEAQDDPYEVIKEIRKYSKEVGISIKPKTEVKEIMDLLPLVDLVLVMSVEPGFGGQKFMENSLQKISELASLREEKNYHYQIEVDGGINKDTIASVALAGADIVVAGSYVFKADDPRERVLSLK